MAILNRPTPAGDFWHRVTVVRRTTTTNELGETVTTDTPGETRWAKVETLTDEERLAGGELLSEVTHRIRLRYFPDLAGDDALDFRGHRLAVKSLVDVDEAQAEWEVLAVGAE